jgi:uncharacterized membrane protein YhaH (DUF805 family)
MGFFDGSGRIGRLAYLGVSLALWFTAMFAVLALIGVDEVSGEPSMNPLLFPIFAGTSWLSMTNTIRRLHDVGRSGWTALLLLVPIIGPGLTIYLLFAPGDQIRNLYGPPPGASEAVSPEAQRQRMELLATAAGEAYRARGGSSYLNDDGSYNMDGLGMENGAPPPTAQGS